MRYYGKVKWFGGYNSKTGKYNNHGFITNIGDKKLNIKDVYFHKDEVLFNSKIVKEGLLVTFDLCNDNIDRCNAKRVQMLDNEDEIQVIERCLDSDYPTVWLSVVKNFSKHVSFDKGIKVVEEKFKEVIIGETLNIINYIPKEYYPRSKVIRSHLNPKQRFSICYKLLNIKDLNKRNKDEILDELIELLNENNFSENLIFDKIPKKFFIENKFLRSKISPLKQFICFLETSKLTSRVSPEVINVLKENNYNQLFIDYLVDKIETEEDIDRLIEILDYFPKDKRILKSRNLSEKLKNNTKIFNYLDSVDKVNVLCNKDENKIKEFWLELDYRTKLYYLYRRSKSNLQIDFLSDVGETHPIIRAVMKIIWSKEKNNLKSEVFAQSHELIQNYVIDTAWDLSIDIKLSPLLPECPFGYVTYCEGKPWQKDREDYVFCPRKNNHCNFEKDKSKFKIYPNCNLPWNEWTLLEVLECSNITPEVEDLLYPGQYVNKLCGWINRLNEIRQRLKCTVCGKTLYSNYKYSKRLAVYNTTVFNCQCGAPSNQSVYISHCWACREIIDSRENNSKFEDYYLCLKCGSGPRTSSTYKQGSICPRCGSKHMSNTDEYNRDYECMICGHSIHLPPQHKLTGIDIERTFEVTELFETLVN